MVKKIKIGGTSNQKGMTYQHGVALFLIIIHHENDKFKIILDSNEDLEVLLFDNTYYLQCKSKELSYGKGLNEIINKLINNSKKENTIYKVICPDFSSISSMQPSDNSKLFKSSVYNIDHKKVNISNNNINLPNIYLVQTYLRGNSSFQEEDKKYLKGELSYLGIDIANQEAIFNALFTEISLRTGSDTIERKSLLPEHYQKLFERSKLKNKIIEEANSLIAKLINNKVIDDNQERKVIYYLQSSELNNELKAHESNIKEILGKWNLEGNYSDMIQKMYNKTFKYCNNRSINFEYQYSLIIYIVSERIIKEFENDNK